MVACETMTESDPGSRNPPRIIHGLAQRLIMLRRERGLTQREVAEAEAVGISREYMSLVETEQRVPARDVLLRLAAFFEVSVDWLITGEGERVVGAAEANEALLIELYRRAGIEDKEALLALAKRLAMPPPKSWTESIHAPINIRKPHAKKASKNLPKTSHNDLG